MSDMTTSPESTDIFARAGKYYRNARYLIVAACVIMGAYFLYDGFIGYPKQNADALALDPNTKLPQSHASILLQKQLGIALPIGGIAYLILMLYKSRGAIRLTGSTLHVPGHPPIPITSITQIDKAKWDLKGIAILDYVLDDGKAGRFKLDDFVYERAPIDAIFKHIEETLVGRSEVKSDVA